MLFIDKNRFRFGYYLGLFNPLCSCSPVPPPFSRNLFYSDSILPLFSPSFLSSFNHVKGRLKRWENPDRSATLEAASFPSYRYHPPVLLRENSSLPKIVSPLLDRPSLFSFSSIPLRVPSCPFSYYRQTFLSICFLSQNTILSSLTSILFRS